MTPTPAKADEGYQRPADPDGLAGLSPVVWKIRTFSTLPHKTFVGRGCRAFTYLKGLKPPVLNDRASVLLGWQAPTTSDPLDAGWLVGTVFYPPHSRRPLAEHRSAIRAHDSGGDPEFCEAAHCQLLSSGLLIFPLSVLGVKTLCGVAGSHGSLLRALLRPRNAPGWIALHDDHLVFWMRCRAYPLPSSSPPFSLQKE